MSGNAIMKIVMITSFLGLVLSFSCSPSNNFRRRDLSSQRRTNALPLQSSSKTTLRETAFDDDNARSQFGTKEYWDDVYLGRGDFPAEEYSWYYGWERLKSYVTEYIPDRSLHLFCPGIGNDPLLLDLIRAGYTRITAMDYSEHAIERQRDLVSYELDQNHPSSSLCNVKLEQMDARSLNPSLDGCFDVILEKGALDAIYLSGDGNVELAVTNFHLVLRPGGIVISVSGVVPETLRADLFDLDHWEWLRDGSGELKAGCFVFKKLP